jgi:hypothetical protein
LIAVVSEDGVRNFLKLQNRLAFSQRAKRNRVEPGLFLACSVSGGLCEIQRYGGARAHELVFEMGWHLQGFACLIEPFCEFKSFEVSQHDCDDAKHVPEIVAKTRFP